MIFSFAGPRTLAFFRIVIFTVALIYVSSTPLQLLAFFPPESTYQLGILHLLPESFCLFLLRPLSLQFLSWITLAVLLGGLAGITRRAPFYMLAAGLMILHEMVRCSLYSRLPHTLLCLNLLILLCCLFPVADAWSWASRKPITLAPQALYRTGVRLMLFSITLFYSFIGTARLLRWFSSGWNDQTMAHFVISGSFRTPEKPYALGLWMVEHPSLLWLGITGFFCFSWVEALAPAALLSRRNCLIWAIAAVMMHMGSAFVLNISFFEQTLLLILFFAEPVLNRLSSGQKEGAHGY